MELSKRDAKNLAKIINALKASTGGLWIREISRQTALHLETVRRLIKKYPFLFEEYADFTQYKINLKIIKLKRIDIDVDNLEKYVKLTKRLGA